MKANEAYKLFKQRYPAFEAVKCYECDSVFVFLRVPSHLINKVDHTKLFDCLSSVNKETKVVRDFKPFYVSKKEYDNRKTVTNFKD